MKIDERRCRARGRTVKYLISEGFAAPARRKLLFSFALDGRTSLTLRPYCLAAEAVAAAGHSVVSFDLPCHGERADERGEGIAGFYARIMAGEDPFKEFVEDADAVLEDCVRAGITGPGKILVAGTSRAGYLALRWMAVEPRVAAAALFAPVTDWAHLSEFQPGAGGIQRFALAHWIPQLKGRPVFCSSGAEDNRVNSQACATFMKALQQADPTHQNVYFRTSAAPGHTVLPEDYQAGADFLLATNLHLPEPLP